MWRLRTWWQAHYMLCQARRACRTRQTTLLPSRAQCWMPVKTRLRKYQNYIYTKNPDDWRLHQTRGNLSWAPHKSTKIIKCKTRATSQSWAHNNYRTKTWSLAMTILWSRCSHKIRVTFHWLCPTCPQTWRARTWCAPQTIQSLWWAVSMSIRVRITDRFYSRQWWSWRQHRKNNRHWLKCTLTESWILKYTDQVFSRNQKRFPRETIKSKR